MAQEIEFSIMGASQEGIQPLLEQFEAEQHIHVRLRLLPWDSGWSQMVKMALYNDGPDVSEVGTTWVGDLIGMHALRPFNAAETAALGKGAAFFPAAWKTASQYGDAHVWSVPWFVGSRLIYYRPALLERAGVDLQTAFQSNQNFGQAIRKLQKAGIRSPWTVPTGYTHTTLLNLASWVWAAGGDFTSPDGKSTRFMEPAAQEGIQAYFELGRYLSEQVRHLNRLEPDNQFLADDQTAMTHSGSWLFCTARSHPELSGDNRIAVALPPGASFVGGSNLVIWKYSHNAEAAVKLIRFLSQSAAQVSYCQTIGLLPARLEALGDPAFASDPFWQVAIQGVQSGRSFPTMRLWGLVEDRLAGGLGAVWSDVLADPSGDPLPILEKHLAPLAKRLDPLLRQG